MPPVRTEALIRVLLHREGTRQRARNRGWKPGKMVRDGEIPSPRGAGQFHRLLRVSTAAEHLLNFRYVDFLVADFSARKLLERDARPFAKF
jgi:hypothetical protein